MRSRIGEAELSRNRLAATSGADGALSNALERNDDDEDDDDGEEEEEDDDDENEEGGRRVASGQRPISNGDTKMRSIISRYR